MTAITEGLFALQDEGYRAFHARLIPDIPYERIIGVRTPDLRRYAKKVAKLPGAKAFLQELPHTYYEENNLHGALLNLLYPDDIDAFLAELERFLPYVDNWSTCDMLSPRCLVSQPERLLGEIALWLHAAEPYTIRFGIGRLMACFLGDRFFLGAPAAVAAVSSEEYYVNMMRAWYFATALAKQYEAVFPWISEGKLDRWTHNKTIQKACESDRISAERKQVLRGLRR